MKTSVAPFLICLGLVATILIIQKDLGWWWLILSFSVFGGGLDLLIRGEIEAAKDKIMEDLEQRLDDIRNGQNGLYE